ncbi:hypothetical protein BAE44_0019073, partial [Dichanthelium oligosanthes]
LPSTSTRRSSSPCCRGGRCRRPAPAAARMMRPGISMYIE